MTNRANNLTLTFEIHKIQMHLCVLQTLKLTVHLSIILLLIALVHPFHFSIILLFTLHPLSKNDRVKVSGNTSRSTFCNDIILRYDTLIFFFSICKRRSAVLNREYCTRCRDIPCSFSIGCKWRSLTSSLPPAFVATGNSKKVSKSKIY